MSQKRSRSINWDEEEKQLFQNVLRDYTHIIEDKSLTTNSNKTKTKAWQEVHKKFNELNCRQRDMNQIKIQWKSMKMNARKKCFTYNREMQRTGGGPRPSSPDDSVIQIKDLLNPAELLRDDNKYDSDGPVIITTPQIKLDTVAASETCVITLQDSKIPYMDKWPASEVVSLDDMNQEAPQDFNIVTVEDVDSQIDAEGPSTIADNKAIMATPLNSNITKKKSTFKRKLISHDGWKKSTKDDYVTSITDHSKKLKEEEHTRRMEMAEELHSIQMAIQKEKLRSAILEREILELKKLREESLL